MMLKNEVTRTNIGRVGSLSATAFLAGSLLALGACGSGGSVSGGGDLVDQMTQGLTGGSFDSINGSYGPGCTDRFPGDWSVAVNGSGNTLDNEPLSVVVNNTSCVLFVTSLRNDTLFSTSDSIQLDTSYRTTAARFINGSDGSVLYANAELDAKTFAADFNVVVLYSNDPNLASGSNGAHYGSVAASATAGAVPAPDYDLDLSGIVVTTDVNNLVLTATGNATLFTDIGPSGQTYVVVGGGGLTAYGDIDAAYLGATTPTDIGDGTIAASVFGLDGADLTTPQVDTLIIANTVAGVRSYQVFEITFNNAAG